MFSESTFREVQSVETAFQIVGVLQDRDGAAMYELANQLNLARSTLHNYLGTLQSLGYVVEQNGTYRLGLRFLTHGMAAKSGLPLRDPIAHALTEISEECSQSVWWIIEEYGRGLFVQNSILEDNQPIYGRIGKRSYLHTHAPGKAILAQLSERYVNQIIEYHGLPIHTRKTITDADELIDELEQIREQGYAVSNGEAALGVRSVGVAFEGPTGYIHGIGVFGHSRDFSGNQARNIQSMLQETIDTIERSTTKEGE